MKKKIFRITVALLVCISLLLCICVFAGADFGNFGGDDDYGGGDDGGDYDYGGDFDDDYGYSGRDSGSSSGDGSGLGVIIAIVLIAGISAISTLRQKRNSDTSSGAATDADELMAMEHYSELDPGFSESELTQRISNLYVQMQQCWTAKDISSLRPYFTDAFFAQMDRQLDELRTNKRTNHVERIAVLYVKLLGYRQQAGMDEIIAEVQTRIVDYTISDATGEVLSGDRNAEKLMTYEYTLTRPTGQTTAAETQTAVTNCPNCGATVNINRTAKCPYCDSIITVDNQSFVISAIRGISQKTL